MTMADRITRQDTEESIQLLVNNYPKCFFQPPHLRRPLKKTIAADLERDGFPAAKELIEAAIGWYQSHFAYQYALQPGAKRIDLTGKEVDTVTELERDNAQKQIRADKQKLTDRSLNDSIRTWRAPVAAAAPSTPVPSTVTVAPALARLHEALIAANAAMTSAGDDTLQRAIAAAALNVLIKEAQHLIDNGREASR
jgi:sRNA-binding protein